MDDVSGVVSRKEIDFKEAEAWTVVKEYSEKGVSGFKVSAKDRDAIQEIQREAVKGSFDILLVFMFDRLGRDRGTAAL